MLTAQAVRRSARLISSSEGAIASSSKKRKISVSSLSSPSLSGDDAARVRSWEKVDIKTENMKVKDGRKPRKKKVYGEPNPVDYTRVTNEWKFGAHVSAEGGVQNAVLNAAKIGANAFALFLKSQRKWSSPDISEESASLFKTRLKAFGYEPNHVIPHGSYLINLGNPDPEKRQKSFECFLDDLRRCELLGLTLYNFHPGSTVGVITKEESISFIAQCLNKAHKETRSVITVIENMAGAGNVVGSKFAEIASIISQVENKARVGVCLDTCHAFAAGYDVRSQKGFNATLEEFDSVVGLQYLRAMHLNDSKTPLGSNKDRHENIGIGYLTLSGFATLARDPRLKNIPLILETPLSSSSHPKGESLDVWRTEIDTLNRLSRISLDFESGKVSPSNGNVEDISLSPTLKEMTRSVEHIVGRKAIVNGGGAGETRRMGGKGKRQVKNKKGIHDEEESQRRNC